MDKFDKLSNILIIVLLVLAGILCMGDIVLVITVLNNLIGGA